MQVDIPPAILDRAFGRDTVTRARAYAAAGHVLEHELSQDGPSIEIRGSVSGTRPVPYRTRVRIEPMRTGVEIWATCTCPVQINCKHAACLLIVAQTESERAPERWSRELDGVLDALDRHAAPPAARSALGLRFEVNSASYRWNDQVLRTVSIRPVQVGKLGRWITTGCNWNDVPGLAWANAHEPEQVAALTRLQVAMGQAYGGAPSLVNAGPMLWPALTQLVDAGVELVPGAGVAQVALRTDPVVLTADLAEDAGDLDVTFRVTDGGDNWTLDEVELLGAKPHGVLIVEPDDAADAVDPRGRRRHRLVLAPLRSRLPEQVRNYLLRNTSLHIPAESRDVFEDGFLPRLRRHLPTTSLDGSVAIPEERPPRLTLELDWTEPGRLLVRGLWSYARGSRSQRFGIDSAEGLVTVRMPEAEAQLLASVSFQESAARLLCDTSGRLRAQTRLEGDDLLAFVADALPGLRAAEAYDLLDVGTPVDYRLATGEPEITFEAADDASPEHTDWLDLEVMVRVDGHQIPVGMILEALTLGSPMAVLAGGLHVRTDHPALARLADLVAAAAEIVEQDGDRLRVGRHDVGLWGEVDELGVVAEEAARWVRSARALKDFDGLPQVDESRLASPLRHYQQQGASWLAYLWEAGLGGVLADDMGLGKTLQTLAAIAHARAGGAGPFLVVAPTSVVSNWALEAARHAPELSVGAITSTKRRRDKTIAELAGACDVVVTSYTLLRLEAEEYAGQAWGGLVLDEAQQIKNHRSRVYRAVRDIEAPYRIALTGTPFENRLMELWSLLSVVAPGLYPSPQRFRENVVRPIERGDNGSLERFRRRIGPFLLRRTKELVAPELPPKQEQVLEVTLGDRHRSIYDTHLQRERQTVMGLVDDFDHHRVAIFRSLTRMRQLSLDAALIDETYSGVGSAKIDVLVEHLVELAGEGHRALVFSQFTSFLRRVRERLEAAGVECVYLDGRTRNRERVIGDFRAGTAPAFLISLKAGGTGLTLTEADYVFVLDPWWNPAVEAQAVDRAHRIGQQRPVMVYRLVAADTIEEKVMALKERKARLFKQVIEGDGVADAAIDAEDVRALFEG